MEDITYTKVKQFAGKYHMIEENDLIAAGVSGGADSVCLLHILWRMHREMAFRLLAVHVDHGVRAEASEDAAYVRELCRRMEIPFYLRKVDMQGYAARNGLSSEEAGRLLRYRAFEEVLGEQKKREENGKVAVAHNCNDRAETMLFHLFRGSGLRGLGSIRPVRESVIRPLLCLERTEIEGYLARHGLQYCQDSTNAEDTYTRNKIRHHILPYAEREICSGAVAHMGDLADILVETEGYLERQTERLYERYVKENRAENTDGRPGSLCIQGGGLLAEDPAMYKRVLLACMERLTPHRKDITGRHIGDLVHLMTAGGSKELSLPYGIRAYKEYGRLYLIKTAKAEKPGERPAVTGAVTAEKERKAEEVYPVEPPAEIFVPGEGVFSFLLLDTVPENNEKEVTGKPKAKLLQKEQNIPENRYTKWFDYDKITTYLLLRTRQQGDYLMIDAAMHTKSVKQYMVNEKIPKMQRDSMHLLADGSHVLWIPGYRISQRYKVDESTRRILQVRFRGGSDGGTN